MKELTGNKLDKFIANKIRNRFIFEAMSYLNSLKKEFKEFQKYSESISTSFSSTFSLIANNELLIIQKAFMDILLISDAKWWKARMKKPAHDIIEEYMESVKNKPNTFEHPKLQRIYTLNDLNDPSVFYDQNS